FSSRRRHTRCYRDWSSDVCSSDLLLVECDGIADGGLSIPPRDQPKGRNAEAAVCNSVAFDQQRAHCVCPCVRVRSSSAKHPTNRSEERRVGKECSVSLERAEIRRH